MLSLVRLDGWIWTALQWILELENWSVYFKNVYSDTTRKISQKRVQMIGQIRLYASFRKAKKSQVYIKRKNNDSQPKSVLCMKWNTIVVVRPVTLRQTFKEQCDAIRQVLPITLEENWGILIIPLLRRLTKRKGSISTGMQNELR